jgi:hypothetical protein
MWFFLTFDITFDPLWHMELSMYTHRADPVFWRRKFRFAVFGSGNILLMKYN